MSKDLIQALTDSSAELLALVGAVPDNQATAKPVPERWSALECVEHLVLSERNLIPRLQGAEKVSEGKPDAERDARFVSRLPDRSVKVKAPEASTPSGGFSSIQEAIQEFRSARAKTIDFVREQGDELYRISLNHPVFGAVNGAEMARLAAFHVRRHAAQIREIQEQLNTQ